MYSIPMYTIGEGGVSTLGQERSSSTRTFRHASLRLRFVDTSRAVVFFFFHVTYSHPRIIVIYLS